MYTADHDSTSLKAPRHIGYILDGNRRWAKKHGVPTYEGHLAGYNALKDVIEASADAGVEYISFYTWSTENWTRAESEVRGVMKLIRRLFKVDIKQRSTRRSRQTAGRYQRDDR